MNNISKIVSIVSYLLLAVSVIFFVLFWTDSIDAGMFLSWSYVLFAIAGGATILFGVFNLIMFPNKAKTTLFGVVGLAVVFGLAYALSSEGSVATSILEKNEVSLSYSHMIGMAIYSMYILGFLAALGIVYTEVSKMFK